MNRLLAPIIVLISILLFFHHCNLCFGYVCIRNSFNFRVVGRHNKHNIRLLAEPPSSSSSTQVTPTVEEHDNEEELRSNRLSKRKRLSSLVRRLRLRLSTFLKRAPSVEVEIVTPPKNNEIMQLEKRKEQTAPSSDEIVTYSRQSTAADDVDLSGSWKPIVTDEFKKEYDSYLVNCSQSFMFRKVVVNGIGYQKEVIRQLNGGADLEIIATNPAGNWNRTLVTSDESRPLNVTITDPDGDRVQVEAWWEGTGTRHKSLLRGKPRVQGGVFETVRYLESTDVLVCESSFHPSPSSSKFKHGEVIWKFRREQ